MLKRKVLVGTMLLAFSITSIAFGAGNGAMNANAATSQAVVDGIALDVTNYSEGNCDITLVDIANPMADEVTPAEQKALEKYGNQQKAKARAAQVMPLDYTGGYKDLNIHSEANNGRYKLDVSGQWYKNSNNSTLQVCGGRFIQGTNMSGYSGRVIQFTETATFSTTGFNGISLSASGFTINGGASSKTATWQSPAHYDTAQASYTNWTDITSTAGAVSYSHTGNYRVEMYTGYSGNYINFGGADSWYM